MAAPPSTPPTSTTTSAGASAQRARSRRRLQPRALVQMHSDCQPPTSTTRPRTEESGFARYPWLSAATGTHTRGRVICLLVLHGEECHLSAGPAWRSVARHLGRSKRPPSARLHAHVLFRVDAGVEVLGAGHGRILASQHEPDQCAALGGETVASGSTQEQEALPRPWRSHWIFTSRSVSGLDTSPPQGSNRPRAVGSPERLRTRVRF